MTIHKRKCHLCGNVADHEDNILPAVLCKKCGSQDTRKVRTHLDHWAFVMEEHASLNRFVDWLESQGIQFDCDGSDITILDDRKPCKLIDRYLKVDQKALDQERVELIRAQRALVESSQRDQPRFVCAGDMDEMLGN